MAADPPKGPRVVTGSDFFNGPPPDPRATTSTSMGHVSGTQQVRPPGPGRNGTMRVAPRPVGVGGFPALNAEGLRQSVNLFGHAVPVYGVLLAAGVAFYIWGFIGIVMLGVLYGISQSFQTPAVGAPANHVQENPREQGPAQPTNRTSGPSPSSSAPRFPGAANRLS